MVTYHISRYTRKLSIAHKRFVSMQVGTNADVVHPAHTSQRLSQPPYLPYDPYQTAGHHQATNQTPFTPSALQTAVGRAASQRRWTAIAVAIGLFLAACAVALSIVALIRSKPRGVVVDRYVMATPSATTITRVAGGSEVYGQLPPMKNVATGAVIDATIQHPGTTVTGAQTKGILLPIEHSGTYSISATVGISWTSPSSARAAAVINNMIMYGPNSILTEASRSTTAVSTDTTYANTQHVVEANVINTLDWSGHLDAGDSVWLVTYPSVHDENRNPYPFEGGLIDGLAWDPVSTSVTVKRYE